MVTILYPLLILLIYFRKLINKEDPIRFKEKIFPNSFKVKHTKNNRLIWFHAASIGELKSIFPIIDELNTFKKSFKFLITTTTLSSGKIAEIEFKHIKNIEHRYFPLDVPFLIKNFLNQWKPDYIFLVDSEIWPSLLSQVHKFNIPIALINARFTLKSFSRWMIFPDIAEEIFKKFSFFLCSNQETKNFLHKLNLKNIFFKGNIKFIGKIDVSKIHDSNENFLINNKVWLAASTHKDEDEFCIKTHLKIKNKIKDIKTIIAPRHIERSRKIYDLAKKFQLKVQILNQNEKVNEKNEIIIINYFGALQNYFKYLKSVFIGKSLSKKFEKNGGQNPIEAAKLNCKVYHGQYVYNFQDIYKLLEEYNLSQKINNHKELSENLIKDLIKTDKKKFELSNYIKLIEQKTLDDTMKIIKSFIL